MLQGKIGRLNVLALLLTLLAFAAMTVVAQNRTLQTKERQVKFKSLERAFEKAAIEFGIPSELLKQSRIRKLILTITTANQV